MLQFAPLRFLRNLAALAATASTLLFTPCLKAGAAQSPVELTVFAAASLTDVMGELALPFEKAHNAKVVFNFAGSNTLAQQIVASPKADVFISASEKWMDTVAKANDIAPETRKSVLSNTLVVIANPASAFAMTKPEELPALGFRFLALGDPNAVPAGKYAKQWLTGIKVGEGNAWDSVKARVSPAPDVRAALGQVEGSEDVIGIVYSTDYVSAKGKARLLYAIPASANLAISYPAAVLREAQQPELARVFLEYLSSAEAKTVFEKHGFTVLK
jgi:molybdate transport system substrate-binding protein